VALKTLLSARAADVYRLKREFRRLADAAHPNLVSLYELIVDGANCFFTMELVDGVNLVEYVRGSTDSPASFRADRTRRVFRQLVDGITELHRRGKLHRDIKPSNLLVTPAGRLVILDFGLTSDVFLNDRATDESMAGTPAYVAPERRAGVAPSEGEDWYGVGVTLYEALTGRLPFEGSFEEMSRRKREADPSPPAAIEPGVPDDLNDICMGMLRRDPGRRLSGAEAVPALEPDVFLAAARRRSDVEMEPAFVGRQQHLDALRSALDAAKDGGATA
jgi:serine/threonine protein kinase